MQPSAGRQQTELERPFLWTEVRWPLVVSSELWLKARSWSSHFFKLPLLGDFTNESHLTSSGWIMEGWGGTRVKNYQEMQLYQDFSTPPVQSRPLAFPHSSSFCQWTRHRSTSCGVKSLKSFLKNAIILKPCVTRQILTLFPKPTLQRDPWLL